LIVLAGLASVASLGFASAFVLAGNSKPESTEFVLCHAPPGTPENLQPKTVDAAQVFGNSGHIEHPDDIIPVFTYTTDGTTTTYEGKNLTETDGWGAPGEEVLEDGCVIGSTTSTSTSTSTETETETDPGTTVPVPPETSTVTTTVTISAPAVTVTAPGTTTVVTVPSGETTTVTLPTQTITLPASTVTLPGETVVRDPVTVIQPGTTQTITAGATTTVVTVTVPTKGVEGGVLGEKATVITVTGPTNTITLPPHIVTEVEKAKALVRTIFKSLIRACQPAIGPGKG
jgi:hypothetical protein